MEGRGGLERCEYCMKDRKSENNWRMNWSHPQIGPFHKGLVFIIIIFLMWTIFKVFIEFVTILLHFLLCFFDCKACGISAPRTRDRTHNPCIGR